MKTIIMFLVILLATTTGFAQAKHDTSHTHKQPATIAQKYTCPMHPEVVKTKPGKCPKCGMTLVAMKKKTSKNGKATSGMKM
jgi:hypothetical protein